MFTSSRIHIIKILVNGVKICVCQQVPDHLKVDNFNTKYDLVVEGNEYGTFHGSLFLHKEKLKLKRPHVDILLESEQQVYKQGQTSKLTCVYILLLRIYVRNNISAQEQRGDLFPVSCIGL